MVELEKIKEEIRLKSLKHGKNDGCRLNDDEELVEMVLEGLARNKLRYGEPYCTCRVLSGNDEEDRKKICPCFWHEKEIEEGGSCRCGLFVKGR